MKYLLQKLVKYVFYHALR